MQRTYELMFIVRPDMTDEDLEKLTSTLSTQVTNAKGNVKAVEKMGKRRLAYTVGTFSEGIYVLFVIEGPGELVFELERRLRVAEPVIKFITVRVDVEQKRLDKVKKIRDSRSSWCRIARCCGCGSSCCRAGRVGCCRNSGASVRIQRLSRIYQEN